MNTGMFIRAQIDGKWQSIDIGDPRLPADKLLEWLVTLPPSGVAVVYERVKDIVHKERKQGERN